MSKGALFDIVAMVLLCGGILLWFIYKPATPVVVSNLNQSFGISMGDVLPSLSDTELARRLDDLVSLHVGWVRIDMAWSEIQADNEKSYHWNDIDRVVAAAESRHINVLPILAYTPAWARKDECTEDTDKCAPEDPAQFATFAAAAAARYAPQGIHVWEIWNEENLTGFWKPQPDAVEYADLLIAAHKAIHGVDPSATVLVGGLGPTKTGPGGINPIDFLTQLYDAHAQSSFEAVAYHPYSYPLSPSVYKNTSGWSELASTNPSIRSVMVAHGDSAKHVWLTEFGVPTGGPTGVSEVAQAQMLTEATSIARSYSWAGPFFWYSYQDLGTSADTNENFFGLLRYDGSYKPSYAAFKTAVQP